VGWGAASRRATGQAQALPAPHRAEGAKGLPIADGRKGRTSRRHRKKAGINSAVRQDRAMP